MMSPVLPSRYSVLSFPAFVKVMRREGTHQQYIVSNAHEVMHVEGRMPHDDIIFMFGIRCHHQNDDTYHEIIYSRSCVVR